MKTKTTITELSHEDLVNLLSTATFGSDWLSCSVASLTHELRAKPGDCREDVWARALLAGDPIYLTDHQAEGCTYGDRGSLTNDEDESAVYRVGLSDVIAGLQFAMDGDFEPGDEDERELAARAAIHLADNSSQFDNAEAEILCQIIMFGSIIYG